jgi:hypothetical protein
MIASSPMIAVFDIFHADGAGERSWQDSAMTMHDATARVRQLGVSLPGEYLIYSQKTGIEISLKATRLSESKPWFSLLPEALSVRYRPTK